jgi:uncharacterized protein YvpB
MFYLTLILAALIIALSIFLFNQARKRLFFVNLVLFGCFFFLIVSQLQQQDIKVTSLPLKQTLISSKTLTNDFALRSSVLLNVPIIRQLPELPRGCEVTSLAMLLQYNGIHVDKMTLAKQVKKNPASYVKKNGNVYFGHPNDGFVGDMYSLKTPGLGVYHQPIRELAERYLPNRVVDLTGSEFNELEKYLSNGMPIWIITNATYKKLPKSAFRKWVTPRGVIEITYYEHSVVITGYDKQFIYFNDPLSGEKNKKAPKREFIDAWVQMGRQAITIASH